MIEIKPVLIAGIKKLQSPDPNDYVGDESDIPTDVPDNGNDVNPDDIEKGRRAIGDDEVWEGEEN